MTHPDRHHHNRAPEHRNFKYPNFKVDSRLHLQRCYSCGGPSGRENYAAAVASGVCAWCGWSAGNPAPEAD